jgi:hypothetical protein
MEPTTIPFDSYLAASAFFAPLPGPDRKRRVRPYLYRVTYCSRDPDEVGCAMTWEVIGGRLCYQVALERQKSGRLRWHCTCADAVFRCENQGKHCKHVKGLLALGRPRQVEGCETARAG